jgi:hypothetical protein
LSGVGREAGNEIQSRSPRNRRIQHSRIKTSRRGREEGLTRCCKMKSREGVLLRFAKASRRRHGDSPLVLAGFFRSCPRRLGTEGWQSSS